MKLPALRPVTSLKSDSGKGVSCEFYKVFMNTHFVESLRTAASESVRYQVYILLAEVCLVEEEGYKNYLRITPECFDKLFVLMKGDVTK